MTKYITEILAEINEDVTKLTNYRDNYAIKTILDYAFTPERKMILPDGTPPFKKDTNPLGMSPANLYQSIKKFYVFLRKDLTKIRREQLFIQLIEGVHPEEAALCIAIKDQKLTSLYPNIKAKVVKESGILLKSDQQEVVEEIKPIKSNEVKPKKTRTKKEKIKEEVEPESKIVPIEENSEENSNTNDEETKETITDDNLNIKGTEDDIAII